MIRWRRQGEVRNGVGILTESFLSRRVNIGPGLSVGALDCSNGDAAAPKANTAMVEGFILG